MGAVGAVVLLGVAQGASAETYREAVEGTAGVVHFWPMGEASGSSLADVVGSADAEVSGGVTLGESGGLAEESATSALFDGSSGAAQASVDLSGTHELTVEFWMKWSAYGSDDRLALEFTPNFNDYAGGFIVDPDATPGSDFAVSVGKGASANTVFFGRPSAGEWHYYAFVIDTEAPAESEITPYVDGHTVSYTKSASGTGAGSFASSTLFWMSRDASTLFGAGSMQDLALYDTTLNASAISEHYDLGQGGPRASFTSTPVQATVGVPVRFDGSGSSSPAGSLVDYAWDFDGGKGYGTDSGESAIESHTFASAGTYTVDLRVKDSTGATATVSHTVTVGAALPAYEQAVETTSGLAHFWPMGEASGTSFADAFGGAGATLEGGVALGEPGGLVGDSSTSALFDGSTGAAQANVDLSGTHELTVEFWMKWSSYGSDDHLALEFTPNFNDYAGGFLVDPDATPGSDFAVSLGKGASANTVFFARPSAGEWHYYAFVIDTEAPAESEITPYVDGHTVSYTKSASGTGAGSFASSTLFWMSRDASTLFGAGSMQDLALYDTTLSSETIGEHYDLGVGGPKAAFGSTPVVATAGVPVRFDGSGSSSPAGSLVDYAWDFDGGKGYGTDSGESAIESHTFASAGTYTVDLRVKDSTGATATVSHTVTVGAALPVYEQAVETTSGLAHFWPMGEASGSLFADVFDGANATLSGDVTLGGPGGLVNDSSTSALFDGSSGAAQANVGLSGTHRLTVELWMKWSSYGADDHLALEFTPNFNDYNGGFLVDPDATPGSDFAVSLGRGSSVNTVFFERPSAGAWHYYAFVLNTEASGETEITPYVDGHAVTYTKSESGTGAGNFADSTLYWMSRDASTLFGAGSMQDLALYETTLSAETILAHYELGKDFLPVATAPPAITGTPVQGEELAASSGTWSAYPEASYSYRWERCYGAGVSCEAIAGANESTLALEGKEVGSILRVTVTATNTVGSASASSQTTIPIESLPPSNVGAPEITGTAQEGRGLRAGTGTWEGSPPLGFAYQWESCDVFGDGCLPIAGANGASYVPGPDDVGGTLRVSVTASNMASSASSVSPVSAEVTQGPFYASQFGAAGSGEGELGDPGGVAIDAAGDVWVLDQGNDRVEEFNGEGGYLSEFGAAGSGHGQLESPAGLALNASGDVWVADTGNDRVEEFSAAGEYLESFGVPGNKHGQFKHPEGIAVGGGYVWVSDTGNGRVQRFNEAGEYVNTVATKGSGAGQVGEPEGMARDAKGDVWVADWSNRRVEEFGEGGEYLGELGSEGVPGGTDVFPYGVAVDGSGNVWVGDVANNRVIELSEGGEYLAQFGAPGDGEGEFRLGAPMGLAVDAHGNIWIADPGNHRVQEWMLPAEAPVSVTPPGVTGEAVAGETLSATAGSWSAGPLEYRYRWQRCNESGSECAAITGAGGQSYVLGGSDVGATVRVLETASNAGGATSEASSATSVIAAATALSNTAPPAISGAAQDGQTLTASTGTWSGSPPSSYAYQWESCNESGGECAAIESATSSEYALSGGDIATTLRVIVTARNGAGSVEATSSASAKVAPEPAGELQPPTVSGIPDARQVLYAERGAWRGTERQFGYQWESCSSTGGECAVIGGATGPEYDLGEGDVGTTVRVRVGVGSAVGALTDVSAVTPVIGAAGALASTGMPRVTGAAQVGHALAASTGGWASGGGSVTYAYQWQTCDELGGHCEDIEGATGSSYTPGAPDAGDALRVRVTASEGVHSLARVSPATPPVAAAAAPVSQQPPLIEGATLVGQTLTATGGQWSGEPASYSYQWKRCTEAGECASITGATASSYTLTESDQGSTLRVVVTAARGGESSSALSAASAAIDPEALTKFSPPSISGVVQSGGGLAAETGIWSGTGPVTYAYQWESCTSGGEECAPIEGADEPEYAPTGGDVGSVLRVKVTATGPLGSQSAYSAATAATPGGEATVEEAEEAAQLTDPAILAASTTATLEGQTIAPGLADEEELASQQALTSSSVSKENPGELAVNTPDGELSLKPLETSSDATTLPTLVNGAVALFANTWPATDTIDRPDALGATAVLQLRSAEAPRSFSWEVGLGAGQQLRQLPDGSVAVVSVSEEAASEPPSDREPVSREAGEEQPESAGEKSEKESEEAESETEAPLETAPSAPTSSTPPEEAPAGQLEPQNTEAQYEAATSAMSAAETETGGAALMVISPPQALDAGGHTVPATLSVAGDTVTMTLKPGETTTFPVLAAMPVAAPSDKTSAERDPFEYGLSDEQPATFENENVKRLQSESAPLHVQTARITIPWDILSPSEAGELARLEGWLKNVEADELTPYITLRTDYKRPNPGVKAYRVAIRNLMKRYDGRVKRWGAWNEPDLSTNYEPAERAGELWQAAESVAVELNCGCTVVAGEFAQYETDGENTDDRFNRVYVGKYRYGLTHYYPNAWKYKNHKANHKAWELHRTPSTWGLHDYKDVVEARTTNLSEFEHFANGRLLGKPRIWVSEAGVELHDNVEKGPPTRLVQPNNEALEFELQTKAANAFTALRYANAPHERISRIERVYYYEYEGPSEAKVKINSNYFDSGLVEVKPEGKGKSHGEPRTAYCYLAYESHRCPPNVVTQANKSAQVNSHGIGAKVSFEWEYLGSGEVHTVEAKEIGTDVIHPQLISVQFTACAPYRYRAVAKNSFGEETKGQYVEVNAYCT